MQAIAHVLTEEPVLAGPITLAQAPILGNDLLALGKDDTDTGKGAGSVQDLQKKVEEVSAQLQMRYAEQEQRFRHQWFNLNFEETEIEEDWRATSFDGQRKYMYGLAVVVMIYSLFAALVYNVRAPALSAASRAPPPAAASRARRRFFRACAAR